MTTPTTRGVTRGFNHTNTPTAPGTTPGLDGRIDRQRGQEKRSVAMITAPNDPDRVVRWHVGHIEEVAA
ncbi:hypothetical protein [Actinokineospora globicatena]|uniref:Uncharacterized protein n=1 Tax=Actinokineospora globicatena TaxID=103729 RepID=A0A9W6VD84_9PSEU|nr:hypothetical protein [Actinokineospora globicatena]GLW95001.1 hypothetical protein Aglo03_58170 [Actinokineospora globicatena]